MKTVLLMLAGLICGVICAVQFVMAIRFQEIGRVVVYGALTIFSIELFAVSLANWLHMRKEKEQNGYA